MKIILYGDLTWRLKFWLLMFKSKIEIIASGKFEHTKKVLAENEIEAIVVGVEMTDVGLSTLRDLCQEATTGELLTLMNPSERNPYHIASKIQKQLG